MIPNGYFRVYNIDYKTFVPYVIWNWYRNIGHIGRYQITHVKTHKPIFIDFTICEVAARSVIEMQNGHQDAIPSYAIDVFGWLTDRCFISTYV